MSRSGCGGRRRLLLVGALVVGLTVVHWTGTSLAGRAGGWTLRARGDGVAQTWPDFRPVAGPLLHLRSENQSTASAETEAPKLTLPYAVSWWIYVTQEKYDDLIVYQAKDEQGAPTDVKLMFREAEAKLPANPEEWRGIVWVEDGSGCHSVAPIGRPGWHRLCLDRKSESAVDLLIDGTLVGTYAARSAKPARLIEVGDFSASDGAGEAYWGEVRIAPGGEGSAGEATLGGWRCAAFGAGVAELDRGCEGVRQANLYLRSSSKASCEAEWGTLGREIEIPYHFWCQVYVSEQPYQDFKVVCPLAADGQPTDIEIEFDEKPDAAASGSSEPSQQGFIWVTDAQGRHSMGSVARGVWHEFAITRRKPGEVALWIDGAPVKTFASRSAKPAASFRFGDAASETTCGEAYWFWIRLVQIPKE